MPRDQAGNLIGKDGHQPHVENTPNLVRICKAEPKGVIGDNTKMGPIYNVLVTRHHGRHGIEVLMDSLASDGSKSWVVISKGVGRCVTELSTECTPVHAR